MLTGDKKKTGKRKRFKSENSKIRLKVAFALESRDLHLAIALDSNNGSIAVRKAQSEVS